MQMLLIIREILATPALLVALVVLVGLIVQKKSVDHIIKGTATTVVGFALLSVGSEFLQNGALKDFGELFNYDFHIQGVIPNMEAVASLGIAQYAAVVSEMMFLGMIANLIMARFGPFHYIFLTGHHTLYMACLLTVVLYGGEQMNQWEILVSGSLILGFLMSCMPALAHREMKKITGSSRIALGHFSVFGYLASAKIAAAVGRREGSRQKGNASQETRKSTEDIHLPAKLSFMRDSTVGIFLVMTVIFLLLTGMAAYGTDLGELNISYKGGGYANWIIYSIMQGAQFSVAIYIILAGVRLIIAEIVPAFKGIAAKMVPHARPAVDCPVLFSYAPNAALLGFLMSFLGGIATMLFLAGINAGSGRFVLPMIVPGVVAHFFCGGSAGVFANAEGGLKGCIAGAFFHGILITLLSMAVMPTLGGLNLSGTTFSDADFCMVGILLGILQRVLPGHGMFSVCVFLFLFPIIREQIRKRREKE